MSTEPTSSELVEYAKQHLLAHMRAAGMSERIIQGALLSLPEGELKEYFITQYLDSVSPTDHEAATQMLRPV